MSGQHKIFSVSENCLTEDQLLLYLQNKLSPFEQHHVEKHLLDCELCSDALEGLRLISSPANLTKTFAELNQKIDERVKHTEKKIIPLYSWLRIAAVIALVAVSAGTFLYLQKQQKQEEKIVAEKQTGISPVQQNNFELKSTEPDRTEPPQEVSTKDFKTPAIIAKKIEQQQVDETKAMDMASSTVAAVAVEKTDDLPPVAVQEQQAAITEMKTEKLNEQAAAMDKSDTGVTRSEMELQKKSMPATRTEAYKNKITSSEELLKEALRRIKEAVAL